MVLERLAMMIPFCEFCSLVRIQQGAFWQTSSQDSAFMNKPFLNIFVVFIEQFITVQARSLAKNSSPLLSHDTLMNKTRAKKRKQFITTFKP